MVNTSTIIQFGDWNQDGFKYMANKYLKKADQFFGASSDDDLDFSEEVPI